MSEKGRPGGPDPASPGARDRDPWEPPERRAPQLGGDPGRAPHHPLTRAPSPSGDFGAFAAPPYVPGGGHPPAKSAGYHNHPGNGLGTAALVLGILSTCSFCTGVGAVALGIAAVVCGVLARARVRRAAASNPGQALAGIILGALGFLLGAVMLVLVVVGIGYAGRGGGTDDGPPPAAPRPDDLFHVSWTAGRTAD
ncbi:DUF4190 domain-containing protein [Streptomyces sp. NPDC006879]|uniref:DUF4190 domain-containing protein n=1 Tax=Streptomyces sp. NPDC006879 TaxID=3364767 RepID=UPI0036D14019